MKIFISHSSKDKWAARQISKDLISIGIETFLDEKDIETGQSIDETIRKNLKICDDFVVILSPASIKSDWVLIELGGAIALEKKIVPILLYVGPNEIPQIINLKLARDINVINLYYDELRQRLNGNKTKATKDIGKEKVNHSLKVGDKVLVISLKPQDVMRRDSLIDWEPAMDSSLGQETTIYAKVATIDEAYMLDIAPSRPGHYYVFAREWLIPIK